MSRLINYESRFGDFISFMILILFGYSLLSKQSWDDWNELQLIVSIISLLFSLVYVREIIRKTRDKMKNKTKDK